ncbi:MAG: glycosyltransferase [Bacteroidales bacterium]|nr:glycosyltransferase [Bacteroidales bacterium]
MELFGHTKDVIRANYFYLMERLCPSRITDAHDIPIIINNYNRLSMLKRLIASLTSRGYHNIVILDNQSTYEPLLKWYGECPYEVIRLPRNFGFKALWKYAPVRKRFCSDYYIYTDPDVELAPGCPADVIERMFHILKDCRQKAFKIGPQIRITDLPDHYAHKQEVIDFESQYFKEKTEEDGLLLYRAPIDTTFALYRPRIGLSRRVSLESYRIAEPYSILHLPWYQDSAHLSEEEQYYVQQCRQATMWSGKK